MSIFFSLPIVLGGTFDLAPQAKTKGCRVLVPKDALECLRMPDSKTALGITTP